MTTQRCHPGLRLSAFLGLLLAALPQSGRTADTKLRSGDEAPAQAEAVDSATMQRLHDEVRAPFKHGIVLRGAAAEKVDCPNVFRHAGRWFLIYTAFNGSGYETRLAQSDNLLDWRLLGPILKRHPGGWDAEQAAGGLALVDHRWNGSWEPQPYDGKYWLPYLGGQLPGYETPSPLVGLAWTTNPTSTNEWTRLPENPVLAASQPDAHPFERDTLLKSHVLRDPVATLGARFVMFCNARQKGVAVERIGLATSKDLKPAVLKPTLPQPSPRTFPNHET